MKKPLIQRRWNRRDRTGERGVTLALVAASIVAMLAMAALSIDVGSLYLAKAEMQRAADTGALAGARSLSLSGMTGDPTNAAGQWAAACLQAEQVARATAAQNSVAGANLPLGDVVSAAQDTTGNFCNAASGPVAFGVNPQVTVTISGVNLPLYFAPAMRAFFSPGASRSVTMGATAAAEVYNPSAAVNFSASGLQLPVAPRCVKPWIVANADPVPHNGNPAGGKFVNLADGSIVNPGFAAPLGTGVIGEQIILRADCFNGAGTCNPPRDAQVGIRNGALEFVPGQTVGPFVAVPSGATGSSFQEASGGCDTRVVYACGTANGALGDLTINPGGSGGDTAVAVESLINYAGGGNDDIDTGVYPFQIQAGSGNPLVTNGVPGVADGTIISASNSIVTVPIFDSTNPLPGGSSPALTIVGFLQLFITDVQTSNNGHLVAKVLNVSGCGTATGTAVGGTSPVPVRLLQ